MSSVSVSVISAGQAAALAKRAVDEGEPVVAFFGSVSFVVQPGESPKEIFLRVTEFFESHPEQVAQIVAQRQERRKPSLFDQIMNAPLRPCPGDIGTRYYDEE